MIGCQARGAGDKGQVIHATQQSCRPLRGLRCLHQAPGADEPGFTLSCRALSTDS
jgi:hypothetical protein